MKKRTGQKQASEETARTILQHTRRSLGRMVPPLMPALYLLEDTPVEGPGPMGTNGTRLFYQPEALVQLFRQDPAAPAWQLLHLASHCLLGHLPKRTGYPEAEAVFDQAADMAAAELSLCLCPRLAPEAVQEYFDLDSQFPRGAPPPGSLEQRIRALAVLRRERPLRWSDSGPCAVDDHGLWSAAGTGAPGGGPLSPADRQAADHAWQEAAAELAGSLDARADGEGSERGAPVPGGRQWGTAAGILRQRFAPASGETDTPYEELLRRLLRPREVCRESPERFDPIWYRAGLDLLGAPLLEPGEEDETPSPERLVVALDTSGSCEGEIMERFLIETAAIFRALGSRWRGTVWLLQCDVELQDVRAVTGPEDWEAIQDDLTVSGFGGTDFRPVFQWAETLEAREGPVRGLIYLTDSWGVFPEEAPDFPVYLVLTTDRCGLSPDIPSWCETVPLSPLAGGRT